jgi:Tol biopolymer transport system component
MYDVMNRRELQTVDLNSDRDTEVSFQWSPTAAELALVDQIMPSDTPYNEVFLINDTNPIRQVTELSQSATIASIIMLPQWSPDSSHLAFWWSSPETLLLARPVFTLTLLEIDTYEIQTFNINAESSGIGEIVWSPDSDALAIISERSDGTWHLSRVNVEMGEVSDIASGILNIEG